MQRKPLGKKLRFEIFDRDSFTCQYCGKTPPDVVLEVDHIVPVVDGGDNERENLRTSCFDCNRGKGARRLNRAVANPNEALRKLQEIAEDDQVARALSLARKVRGELQHEVAAYLQDICGGQEAKPQNVRTISAACVEFGVENVTEWLELAAVRTAKGAPYVSQYQLVRYFCGICKNKRKEANDE